MREDLLGYLMGALDADERCRVEKQLEADESLRRELEAIEEHLGTLDDAVRQYDPPPELAERTCEFVFSEVDRIAPRQKDPLATPVAGRWSIVDAMMLCIICIIGAVVFLPALQTSRFNARVLECQYKLSQLGTRLVSYACLQPDGSFPSVALDGNRSFAGVFVPKLTRGQFLGPRQLHILICPDSPLADETDAWRPPTLDEIDRASGPTLATLQERAGGTIAYNLGYHKDGHYCTPKYRGRTYYLIAADAPSYHLAGRRSANHGGRGQNYLYEAGHVIFISDRRPLGCQDDPLLNDEGYLEYGRDEDDIVLAPSPVSPYTGVYWNQ